MRLVEISDDLWINPHWVLLVSHAEGVTSIRMGVAGPYGPHTITVETPLMTVVNFLNAHDGDTLVPPDA